MNSIDEAIESVREKNLRELEDRLTEAARINLDNTRTAIRSLVPPDSPEYVILDAIASNLTIGREGDGYPNRNISPELERQYVRMVRALGYNGNTLAKHERTGFLTLLDGMDTYYPPSVTFDRITKEEHRAHYNAWCTLDKFKQYNPVG